jgi:hypothetical protein
MFFETFINLGINQGIIYQIISKRFSASIKLWMLFINYSAAVLYFKKCIYFKLLLQFIHKKTQFGLF